MLVGLYFWMVTLEVFQKNNRFFFHLPLETTNSKTKKTNSIVAVFD